MAETRLHTRRRLAPWAGMSCGVIDVLVTGAEVIEGAVDIPQGVNGGGPGRSKLDPYVTHVGTSGSGRAGCSGKRRC